MNEVNDGLRTCAHIVLPRFDRLGWKKPAVNQTTRALRLRASRKMAARVVRGNQGHRPRSWISITSKKCRVMLENQTPNPNKPSWKFADCADFVSRCGLM